MEKVASIRSGKTAEDVYRNVYESMDKLKSPEECRDFYDNWCDTYDEDVSGCKWNTWKLLANKINDLIKEKNLDSKSLKILDICAGTGLVGHALKQNGYDGEIDALDGCEKMLKIAEQKNLYNKYILEMVTGDKLKNVAHNHYDIVCTTGSFALGHLNAKALPPLSDPIKSGGYALMLVNATLLTHPYLEGLEETMKKMEDDKIWTILRREIIPDYVVNCDGVLFVCQKL